MQNAIAFWDKTAPKYAQSPIADVESYEYTLSRTRSYLSVQDSVLELGCGTGSTALLLAQSVGHIHATDFSPAMIEIGRKKAQAESVTNITFETTDTTSPPPEQQYDAVLAFNLLHLVEDIDAALARIKAQIKPGGLFISKTVCKPMGGLSLKHRLMFLALPIAQALGKAPFVRFTPVAEWDAKIESFGFKLLETGNHPVAPPSRYIVARKL